jgi:hypothetical protein
VLSRRNPDISARAGFLEATSRGGERPLGVLRTCCVWFLTHSSVLCGSCPPTACNRPPLCPVPSPDPLPEPPSSCGRLQAKRTARTAEHGGFAKHTMSHPSASPSSSGGSSVLASLRRLFGAAPAASSAAASSGRGHARPPPEESEAKRARYAHVPSNEPHAVSQRTSNQLQSEVLVHWRQCVEFPDATFLTLCALDVCRGTCVSL